MGRLTAALVLICTVLLTACSFDQAWNGRFGGAQPGIWEKHGVILKGNGQSEPCVLYESGAQLISTPNPVFEMWFSDGPAGGIRYAESTDGLTWTEYSGAVVANHFRCGLAHVDGTYHLLAVNFVGVAPDTQIDYFTSPDGIHWNMVAAGVIVPSSGNAFDCQHVANTAPYYSRSNGTWYVLYEGDGCGYMWSTGLAAGPSLSTLSKYSSKPVITSRIGTQGAPAPIQVVGNTFYTWTNCSFDQGYLPSDVCRWKSTDPSWKTWIQEPRNFPTYWRTEKYEGANTGQGQAGDVSIVEANGKSYLFAGVTPDGSTLPELHITVAVANMSLANLVNTDEGVIDPSKSSAQAVQGSVTGPPR
jgi:hypothetical protein